MAVGLLVASQHPVSVVCGLAYLLVFYPIIIRDEARFLRDKFQGEYDAWAAEVPLFMPRLLPGGPRDSRFQISRLAANHEWRSVLGLALLAAFLTLRLE